MPLLPLHWDQFQITEGTTTVISFGRDVATLAQNKSEASYQGKARSDEKGKGLLTANQC